MLYWLMLYWLWKHCSLPFYERCCQKESVKWVDKRYYISCNVVQTKHTCSTAFPYGIKNYCAGTLATQGRVLCRILHGQAVFYCVHCWQYHIDAYQVSVRKHRRQHALRERYEWCEHRGEEEITEQTSGVHVLSLSYAVFAGRLRPILVSCASLSNSFV